MAHPAPSYFCWRVGQAPCVSVPSSCDCLLVLACAVTSRPAVHRCVEPTSPSARAPETLLARNEHDRYSTTTQTVYPPVNTCMQRPSMFAAPQQAVPATCPGLLQPALTQSPPTARLGGAVSSCCLALLVARALRQLHPVRDFTVPLGNDPAEPNRQHDGLWTLSAVLAQGEGTAARLHMGVTLLQIDSQRLWQQAKSMGPPRTGWDSCTFPCACSCCC